MLGALADVVPSCPGTCQAVARVTGYNLGRSSAGTYRAPFSGRLVSWSVAVGAPTVEQSAYFEALFGSPPQARIAVLRRVGREGRRLIARGPAVALSALLGGRASFRLSPPLPVRAGDLVALSVPTWAPVLAIGQPAGDRWLSSRPAGQCAGLDLEAEHRRRGSVRAYGCRYSTSRLTYAATLRRGGP